MRFTIAFRDVELDLDELWPDGDGPANPTTSDVAALIARCGGIAPVIDDWNLISGATVYGPGGAVDVR